MTTLATILSIFIIAASAIATLIWIYALGIFLLLRWNNRARDDDAVVYDPEQAEKQR